MINHGQDHYYSEYDVVDESMIIPWVRENIVKDKSAMINISSITPITQAQYEYLTGKSFAAN